MQDGDTQTDTSFAAPDSVEQPEVPKNIATLEHKSEHDLPQQSTSEVDTEPNTDTPSQSQGRRRITFSSFASWAKSGARHDFPRQVSAPLQNSTVSKSEQDSSRSRFNPRRLFWKKDQKDEVDVEQGLPGLHTRPGETSVQSSSAAGSSRASHRSQPSTSSTGPGSSESSGASERSSLVSPTILPTTSQAISRFRELLGERAQEPLWSSIPVSPVRPPTASSSTSSVACPYPPVPDPIDPARRLGKNQIWFQRVLVWLVVAILNGACVVAYVESSRHAWVLGLILFVKAKDVLSTIFALVFLSSRKLWRTLTRWKPEAVAPKQILSMVTCYNETEEQIMKTIDSIRENELDPHQNVICLILDGKPKELVKRRMLRTVRTLRRPYITWQHTRNEVVVDAGFLDGTPIIWIEKVKNFGKKDSLILGHDLFNNMRDDAHQYTKLLREEIWGTMLPSLTMLPGDPRIDGIFCTDADSTIHKDALKLLVESLARDKRAIAACGILIAELGPMEWSIWQLFQNFQYAYGQFVRRRAEGVWGRVTCLPGCITMIAVRPEMGPAISQYARPVTDKAFFRHQVQYLGTDRRLTYSMLSQSKDLRTVFVPDAVSETVVPQSLSHYLSQRRRWGSNAYFNDWFYLLGPHQYLITRLWALIDISRMTIVYCRQANNILFIYGLVRNFSIIKIIPLLIVTQIPTAWFVMSVIIFQPLLRRRLHKLVFGLLINYSISWCLSILVFTRIVLELGSTSWGQTGTSTASHDPMLRVRTPRNSVARRLSSLFGGSNASDVGNQRGSRRSSLLRRLSFTRFNLGPQFYEQDGQQQPASLLRRMSLTMFSNGSNTSLPTMQRIRTEEARSIHPRPGSASAPVSPGWFSNVVWRSSREAVSRNVQPTGSGDQSVSHPRRSIAQESSNESDRHSEKSG